MHADLAGSAAAGEVIAGVRRIGVLRANALGDLVFALPALEALRRTYRDAEIVLIAREWHAAFLRDRPGPVDRVIALPHGALGDEVDAAYPAADRERLIGELREEGFDLCLQMHGGGRHSNPFASSVGARHTAGARTPDAAALDRWIPYVYHQSEVVRHLETVALVGATCGPLEARLAVTDRDRAESLLVVPEDGRPLAVIHPGATDARRRWPAGRFAAVADALARTGADVVVTGAGDEIALAASVAEATAGRATSVAGRLSLGGLVGLLARASIVVSNDTGPLHLAAAVGVPTAGIYWCMNLINGGPLTRSRHRPLVSWQVTCPRCGADMIRGECGHRESLVADVPLGDVVDAALELLNS